MPDSSNAALLVRCHAGEDSCIAVYKPMRGETPLWDFPDGTLHRREVAAFALARALGWPRVPPTVLRDGPYGPGSVQLFVPFDPQHHFFTLEMDHADVFRRVALFDIAANNADRKGGHCLLDADGNVWLIDHGVCFAVEPKLRTVIWTFVGEPLPDDAVADLARVHAELDRRARRGDDAPLAPRRPTRSAPCGADRAAARGRAVSGARAGGPPATHGRRSDPPPPHRGDAARGLRDRRVADRCRRNHRRGRRGPARVGSSGRSTPRCALRRMRALRAAARELERYFAGRLRVFRTPVDLSLARTPLARGILEVTRTIPYGELWTYGDVAAAAGRPGAARAAGSTLAHSPIEIFVPCHRVVPAGPGLGSYGGEEDRRATLLRLERAI